MCFRVRLEFDELRPFSDCRAEGMDSFCVAEIAASPSRNATPLDVSVPD